MIRSIGSVYGFRVLHTIPTERMGAWPRYLAGPSLGAREYIPAILADLTQRSMNRTAELPRTRRPGTERLCLLWTPDFDDYALRTGSGSLVSCCLAQL